MKNLFNQFINQCATEAVNATRICPRCLINQISLDGDICFNCYETIQGRDQRNDSGV